MVLNCFNSFATICETVQTVPLHEVATYTPLNRGVNDSHAPGQVSYAMSWLSAASGNSVRSDLFIARAKQRERISLSSSGGEGWGEEAIF